MGKSVANLIDVATRAGVSKSTVSRVLNNKLGNGFSVRNEVRQRILKVAEELNYRPNLVAQGLTQQRIRMISVLGGSHALNDLGNIYQTVINNVTRVLDAAGEFDVTVDMSAHNAGAIELPAWKVDGAIVLARCSDETVDELSSRGIPYIVVNGPCRGEGSSIVPDDVQGTRLAVEHLYELGHRRIAYANAPLGHLAGHSSVFERHDTYLSELNRLGLDAIGGDSEPLIDSVDFVKSVVFEQKATAIIAYGHMNALNIMQATHSLGIAIPQQLSLMAFCDEYAANVMSPGLTFIDLPAKKMGETAAKMLLKEIKDPQQNPEHIKLREKLVFRDTTAPPQTESELK